MRLFFLFTLLRESNSSEQPVNSLRRKPRCTVVVLLAFSAFIHDFDLGVREERECQSRSKGKTHLF